MTGFLRFFPTFSTNKHWWRLRAFSSFGRGTREPRLARPQKGRLRQSHMYIAMKDAQLDNTFLLITLWSYDETIDPDEHLDVFLTQANLYTNDDAILC